MEIQEYEEAISYIAKPNISYLVSHGSYLPHQSLYDDFPILATPPNSQISEAYFYEEFQQLINNQSGIIIAYKAESLWYSACRFKISSKLFTIKYQLVVVATRARRYKFDTLQAYRFLRQAIVILRSEYGKVKPRKTKLPALYFMHCYCLIEMTQYREALETLLAAYLLVKTLSEELKKKYIIHSLYLKSRVHEAQGNFDQSMKCLESAQRFSLIHGIDNKLTTNIKLLIHKSKSKDKKFFKENIDKKYNTFHTTKAIPINQAKRTTPLKISNRYQPRYVYAVKNRKILKSLHDDSRIKKMLTSSHVDLTLEDFNMTVDPLQNLILSRPVYDSTKAVQPSSKNIPKAENEQCISEGYEESKEELSREGSYRRSYASSNQARYFSAYYSYITYEKSSNRGRSKLNIAYYMYALEIPESPMFCYKRKSQLTSMYPRKSSLDYYLDFDSTYKYVHYSSFVLRGGLVIRLITTELKFIGEQSQYLCLEALVKFSHQYHLVRMQWTIEKLMRFKSKLVEFLMELGHIIMEKKLIPMNYYVCLPALNCHLVRKFLEINKNSIILNKYAKIHKPILHDNSAIPSFYKNYETIRAIKAAYFRYITTIVAYKTKKYLVQHNFFYLAKYPTYKRISSVLLEKPVTSWRSSINVEGLFLKEKMVNITVGTMATIKTRSKRQSSILNESFSKFFKTNWILESCLPTMNMFDTEIRYGLSYTELFSYMKSYLLRNDKSSATLKINTYFYKKAIEYRVVVDGAGPCIVSLIKFYAKKVYRSDLYFYKIEVVPNQSKTKQLKLVLTKFDMNALISEKHIDLYYIMVALSKFMTYRKLGVYPTIALKFPLDSPEQHIYSNQMTKFRDRSHYVDELSFLRTHIKTSRNIFYKSVRIKIDKKTLYAVLTVRHIDNCEDVYICAYFQLTNRMTSFYLSRQLIESLSTELSDKLQTNLTVPNTTANILEYMCQPQLTKIGKFLWNYLIYMIEFRSESMGSRQQLVATIGQQKIFLHYAAYIESTEVNTNNTEALRIECCLLNRQNKAYEDLSESFVSISHNETCQFYVLMNISFLTTNAKIGMLFGFEQLAMIFLSVSCKRKMHPDLNVVLYSLAEIRKLFNASIREVVRCLRETLADSSATEVCSSIHKAHCLVSEIEGKIKYYSRIPQERRYSSWCSMNLVKSLARSQYLEVIYKGFLRVGSRSVCAIFASRYKNKLIVKTHRLTSNKSGCRLETTNCGFNFVSSYDTYKVSKHCNKRIFSRLRNRLILQDYQQQ